MAGRKKKQKCPEVAGWMTTFTDMTTLLLTFFILMFTTAEVDGYELKLILSSFTGSFGIMPGGLTLQDGPLAQMGMTVETLPSKEAADNLAKAVKEAESQFKPETTQKKIKVTDNVRGLIISIPAQAYFEPDSAELKPKGKVILEKVSRLLLNLKSDYGVNNQVEIEGHASKEPESTSFRNNLSHIWERNLDLSLERAKNVEKYLIEKYQEKGERPIIEKRKGKLPIAKFVAKGFGEFQPLENNDSPESRYWNRRVDIVINRD